MNKIEEGQIQIHTENIFPIIKKAVYSDHEIFLRELVSNGVDAINKRRMASMAGDCESSDSEPKINIIINKEEKTLTISDNGIGMTAEEIKKYINQVAFSSAEEFLQKYENNKESIIGHFGLGFYSSFMVAREVEILTKSAKKDSKGYKWKCDGSPKFSIEESLKELPGTDIILYLMEEEKEYLEPERIKTLVKKYCDFMPFDVQLSGTSINKQDPPWRKNPQSMKDQDYIDLYRYLYPFQGDPLLWVHLNTDYPYNLQGILYFPKMGGRADWESGEIKLYSNQVFVSDSIKDIVPRFLLPLRGVIDSTDIPLNVSRSALQSNRKVKSIGNFISKKIADKLKSIKKDNSEFYAEIWDSTSPFIKIGAMEDEKFAEQVEDLIIFKTIRKIEFNDEDNIISYNNNKYTTIKDYISRLNTSENKRIIYCTDETTQLNPLNLWQEKGNEILIADTVIDSQYIPWVETRKENVSFQRVDSEIEEEISNKSTDIKKINEDKNDDSLKEIIKDALGNENITIQLRELKGNTSIPSLILLPEQMRRMNDIGALMEQKIPGLPKNHVLLINKNHPIVTSLFKLHENSIIVAKEGNTQNEKLIKDVSVHLYQMACLSIGGLDSTGLANIQKTSSDLLGSLLSKLV